MRREMVTTLYNDEGNNELIIGFMESSHVSLMKNFCQMIEFQVTCTSCIATSDKLIIISC